MKGNPLIALGILDGRIRLHQRNNIVQGLVRLQRYLESIDIAQIGRRSLYEEPSGAVPSLRIGSTPTPDMGYRLPQLAHVSNPYPVSKPRPWICGDAWAGAQRLDRTRVHTGRRAGRAQLDNHLIREIGPARSRWRIVRPEHD